MSLAARTGQAAISSERIESALRAVLEREGIPEPPPQPSWLERLLERLPDIGGAGAPVLRVLLALGIAGLIGWLIVLLRRLPQRIERPFRVPHAPPEERARRASELRRRARAAEAQGELLLALRLAFLALLVELDRSGGLEFRPAWTDRELLLRGRLDERVGARLAPLVDELEPKVFGGRPVAASDLRRLEALAAELGVGA